MDDELLAKEVRDAEEKKRKAAILGSISDNLASRGSFGHYFLGMKPNQATSGARLAEKTAEGIDSELALKKDKYKQLLARKQKLEDDARNFEQQKQLALLKQSAKGPTLTAAQEAVDKKFGDVYTDFASRGGYADVSKNLEQLREARNKLADTDMASGPIVGMMPKGMRDVVTPGGAAIQDTIEEVVQRNLREVLGAQFTEKEGQRLIERAYNPRLSEEENIKRLDRLISQIQQAAQAKAKASEYYEQHGTLVGFKGAKPNDFFNDSDQDMSGGGMFSNMAHAGEKEEGPHGRTVRQNGFTYEWNPKTGRYE